LYKRFQMPNSISKLAIGSTDRGTSGRKAALMSFDVYLQCFDMGEPAGISRDSVRDAFGTAVTESEPDRWRVSFDAQNSCDVYSSFDASAEMLQGLSVNRPCGDLRLWDALASVLTLGNVVRYFPGCKAPLVANLDVSRHLSRDMIATLGEPIIAGSGADILREIHAV
jgi:hypothetical protein